MALYQVAIKDGGVVVYAGTEEACSPNEAINQAAKWAQQPYSAGEAYDAHDDDIDAKPLAAKAIAPYFGQFRTVV